VLADDPQGRVAGFDGDGLGGVDALAGDLDAAAAGDLPLDGQAGLRQRVWPGEADTLRARWVSRTRGFTVKEERRTSSRPRRLLVLLMPSVAAQIVRVRVV
jgi:hypothetical protein